MERVSTGVSLLCLLCGAVLIGVTALPPTLRLLAITAWLFVGWRQTRRKRIRRLRIYANGDVHLQSEHGQWFEGRIRPGSVFLPAVAWLRVDGLFTYQGLFVQNDESPAEWRRLRVIARHFADI